MKCKRWDARLPGVVAMALALGCESSAPIAAPSTSRADELSASVGAPTAAAHIGWEIFGSASATAADGLKIIVTGNGTFVAPADGGGRSSLRREAVEPQAPRPGVETGRPGMRATR